MCIVSFSPISYPCFLSLLLYYPIPALCWRGKCRKLLKGNPQFFFGTPCISMLPSFRTSIIQLCLYVSYPSVFHLSKLLFLLPPPSLPNSNPFCSLLFPSTPYKAHPLFEAIDHGRVCGCFKKISRQRDSSHFESSHQ